MKIVFSMDGIKNMDLLYTWTTEYSDEIGFEGEVEHYHGTDYCIQTMSSLTGWESIKYFGQLGKIANETFMLTATDKTEYTVFFLISTYDRGVARIEVTVIASETKAYDQRLEKLKVELKDKLLSDWQTCTWLVDEQSAKLCKEAYERAFTIENNLRAFASKLLIHFLGVNWLRYAGLEKQDESVKNLKDKFTQRVPEFDNINTDFLSMTLETLTKIIFEGVVYNEEIVLGRQEYAKLQNIAKNGKNAEKMFEYLKCQRKVYKNIWSDLFEPYIDSSADFKAATQNFIENRNHVAHSKVLSLSSYLVIIKEFSRLDMLIKEADEKFDEEEASNEQLYTWDAEQELQDYPEDEKTYYRNRGAGEAGIDILDESQIEDWFDETLHEKLYSDVYQHYHLDVCYEISDFTPPSENELLFTVSCPVDESGCVRIDVFAKSDVDDDLGGDSVCYMIAQNGESGIIGKAEISIHNDGNGSEGEDGFMEADEATEYNNSELDNFKEELFKAIDELNPYPARLDVLINESKGVEKFVADFPCEQCGRFGVSVNRALLPIGKCCYCGWENEMIE